MISCWDVNNLQSLIWKEDIKDKHSKGSEL